MRNVALTRNVHSYLHCFISMSQRSIRSLQGPGANAPELQVQPARCNSLKPCWTTLIPVQGCCNSPIPAVLSRIHSLYYTLCLQALVNGSLSTEQLRGVLLGELIEFLPIWGMIQYCSKHSIVHVAYFFFFLVFALLLPLPTEYKTDYNCIHDTFQKYDSMCCLAWGNIIMQLKTVNVQGEMCMYF